MKSALAWWCRQNEYRTAQSSFLFSTPSSLSLLVISASSATFLFHLSEVVKKVFKLCWGSFLFFAPSPPPLSLLLLLLLNHHHCCPRRRRHLCWGHQHLYTCIVMKQSTAAPIGIIFLYHWQNRPIQKCFNVKRHPFRPNNYVKRDLYSGSNSNVNKAC